MSKGGFNCKFTFEPLECQMCYKYLRDPQTTTCCGQNFCEICIRQVKENEGSCPDCSEALVYSPYKKFSEVLLQFKVTCTHKCGWSGPLKQHDQHLNTDPPDQTWLDGCPKVEVQCIYCKIECRSRQHYLQCLEDEFEPSKLPRIYDITGSDEVCSKWEVIGQELSLRDSVLQIIKKEIGKNDPKDFYYEMLKQWIESTHLPNWRKLLGAFKNSAVKLKELAGMIKQGLLCDMASEQQVTQLTGEADNLKEEYRMQQARPRQLAEVKDRIKKCLKSLRRKLGDLVFEENVKLRDQGLEKNPRKPNMPQMHSDGIL